MAALLARSARRRPPSWRWWFALFFFVWSIAFAVQDVVSGPSLLSASFMCYGVFWWRSLHHPPRYYALNSVGWAYVGIALTFLAPVL